MTDLPLAIPVDDKVTADITIKVSGPTTMSSVLIIESIVAEDAINVANGTQLAAIRLPTEVTVNLDNSTTDTVDVSWNAGTPLYNGRTAGTYVFSGTLTVTGTMLNVLGLKASVSVVVAAP